MILFDAHVHIQKNFTLEHLFTAARANFSKQLQEVSPGRPGIFFLLLTEVGNCDCFANLKNQATAARVYSLAGWRIAPTKESESLLAIHDNRPEDRLFLLAGRQIVTAERREVLALATTAKIRDGLSLLETVDTVRHQGGLAVLPWGAGKWLGKRGRLVEEFLKNANPEHLFVGDNGGRPIFWPRPSQFNTAASRSIRLLPGSDPLSLPGEMERIGSYGAMVEGKCSDDYPAESLKGLLTMRGGKITPFGRRLGVVHFFKTQLALRRR